MTETREDMLLRMFDTLKEDLKGEIRDIKNDLRTDLREIKAHVKETNGRVTALEKWKYGLGTGIAVLTFVTPLFWVVVMR